MKESEFYTIEEVEALIEEGSIFQCPVCGAYSAYDPNLATENEIEGEIKVFTVGAADVVSSQCGNCRNYIVTADQNASPYLAEVYTHIPYPHEESE